ncbi:MAG: hypothetical protein J0H68_01725 [Sphingobacteriia bacterium]|nr:hypothetical protein [Sphingobacteriia bacterium]
MSKVNEEIYGGIKNTLKDCDGINFIKCIKALKNKDDGLFKEVIKRDNYLIFYNLLEVENWKNNHDPTLEIIQLANEVKMNIGKMLVATFNLCLTNENIAGLQRFLKIVKENNIKIDKHVFKINDLINIRDLCKYLQASLERQNHRMTHELLDIIKECKISIYTTIFEEYDKIIRDVLTNGNLEVIKEFTNLIIKENKKELNKGLKFEFNYILFKAIKENNLEKISLLIECAKSIYGNLNKILECENLNLFAEAVSYKNLEALKLLTKNIDNSLLRELMKKNNYSVFASSLVSNHFTFSDSPEKNDLLIFEYLLESASTCNIKLNKVIKADEYEVIRLLTNEVNVCSPKWRVCVTKIFKSLATNEIVEIINYVKANFDKAEIAAKLELLKDSIDKNNNTHRGHFDSSKSNNKGAQLGD